MVSWSVHRQLKRARRDDNIISPQGLVWQGKTRAKQQNAKEPYSNLWVRKQQKHNAEIKAPPSQEPRAYNHSKVIYTLLGTKYFLLIKSLTHNFFYTKHSTLKRRPAHAKPDFNWLSGPRNGTWKRTCGISCLRSLAPMPRLQCSTTQATFTNPSLLRATPLLRGMF